MKKNNNNFNVVPRKRYLDAVKGLSECEIEKHLETDSKQTAIELFLAIRLVFGAISNITFKAFYIIRRRLKDDEIEEYHYKGQQDSIKRQPYRYISDMKQKISYEAG